MFTRLFQMASNRESNSISTIRVFSIRPGGSTLGVRAVFMGNAQIGLVSRHLTEEESEQLDKLTVLQIGYDALVFITDVDNPVKQVSSYELREVYKGEVDDWSQIWR